MHQRTLKSIVHEYVDVLYIFDDINVFKKLALILRWKGFMSFMRKIFLGAGIFAAFTKCFVSDTNKLKKAMLKIALGIQML